MGTKVYGNYEDLITFTRASGGHALRPVSYGSELVTNGDFATDSDWTKSGGSTISSGEGHIVSTGSFVSLIQNIGAVTGKIYFVTIDVTVNSGAGVYIGIGGGAVDSRRYDATYTGTHSFALVAGPNDTNVQITRANVTNTDVDNISIKEVTFDQPDGTLTLFEHPDNIPRVEWDAQRNRLGLLVEEARTNLWIFSQDMSQISFGGTGGTATTDQYVAPDGTQTGDLVTMTSGQVYAYKSATISTSTNVAYTISCYVKAAEANTSVGFRIGEFGGAAAGKFHDSDYTAISSTEWTRLDFTQTLEQSDRTQVQAVIRTTSATGSLLIWGVQLEQGSFPTSYIKTTSSTATRSADVASIPVADFGYNQSAWSVVIDTQPIVNDDADIIAEFTTDTSKRLGLQSITGSARWYSVLSGGNTGSGSTGGFDISQHKFAFAIAQNDAQAALDGTLFGSDSLIDVPRAVTLNISNRGSGAESYTGYIKSIQYYPRRLTNAQLQALTS